MTLFLTAPVNKSKQKKKEKKRPGAAAGVSLTCAESRPHILLTGRTDVTAGGNATLQDSLESPTGYTSA
jgi:hypothetical protein